MRTLTILFLLLVPFACVHTAETRTDAARIERPFLWEIRQGGAKHHVLGTMHVGVDARREISPSVWNALEAAPCVVVEADQTAVDMGQLYSMSRLPDGERLSKQLKPAAWQQLQETLGKAAGATLDTSAPWFATLMLLQDMSPAGEPMDLLFVKTARDRGKRVDYLEDWREAIGAFAAVTDVYDLEDLLLHGDKAREDTDAMLAAYRAGDVQRLEAVIDSVNARTPDAEHKLDVLLAQRNARWVPRLLKSLAKGPCFVAVGVGHLVGKENLLTLLQARGFAVKRL